VCKRSDLKRVCNCVLFGLISLQQPGGFKPCKFFSIDRVFRNESLDATHLAEFHQIEGVVADYGLGLADLIGVITEFFSRVGKWQQAA
jgi:phenylalanyl-tRNA synthetase alpha subunit